MKTNWDDFILGLDCALTIALKELDRGKIVAKIQREIEIIKKAENIK
jgi:hypothetical protein